MEDGPPIFKQDFSCPALLSAVNSFLRIPAYHRLRGSFPSPSAQYVNYNRLVRVRSPLLTESRLISFPAAIEMFQFAAFASFTYVFSKKYRLNGGFPHSDIHGSKTALVSPWLFAECHVLLRLLVPRHPPNALVCLFIIAYA